MCALRRIQCLKKKKKRKKKNDFYFIHRFGEILHSANNKCPQYWLQVKRNVFFFMVWLVRQYHASDHLTWDNTGRQRGLYLDSTLGPRICILSKWFLKKSVKHLGLLCGSFFFYNIYSISSTLHSAPEDHKTSSDWRGRGWSVEDSARVSS